MRKRSICQPGLGSLGRLAFGAVLGGVTLGFVPTASAALSCGVRSDILAVLAEEYGEAPVAVGVASNGGLVEVVASKDGFTWTIILTFPNGASCLVLHGDDWHEIRPVASGDLSV